MDIEIIMGNCPITIPMVHTYYYNSSNYGVQIKECYLFILYLTFVTGSGKYTYIWYRCFGRVKKSHIQRAGCQPEKST